MNQKKASAEARKIRRREAKQLRINITILIVCAVTLILCVLRYVMCGDHAVWRTALMAVGAAIYLFSYSTVVADSWTIGMAPPAVFGTLLAAVASTYDILTQGKAALRVPLNIVIAAPALLALAFGLIQAAMLAGSLRTARGGDDVTAVVLGCRLRGDQPGRMLRRRLDAAARFAEKRPQVMCIVSGGRGDDEERTEAEAMRDYLVEKGVSPDRIICEDRSATTYENIRFSLEIAKNVGLPERFAIVTDRFHQLRARLICRDNGIESCSVNVRTPWYLAPQFWAREVLCLIEKKIKRL